MIAIEELKKLDKTQLGVLTVVTGEDVGQYSLLKQELLEKIGYDPSDLAYAYFDLSESSYADVAMDLESLPFFSEEKVVILDHVLDLTTQKKSYLSEEDMKQLEHYLEHPLPTTRLILFAEGKLDGKRRVVKILKRDARVLEAEPLKEGVFKTHFQKEAHGLGLVFEAGVFEELVARSQLEFSTMHQNLQFLASYKKEGKVTHQDLVDAIPKSLQDNLFDLTQFVLQQKVEAARQLVRDLTLQGQDEIKLLAIMTSQFRLLLQTKLLLKKGQSEGEIVASLSDYIGRRLNPYQVRYAIRDANPLSVSYLEKALLSLIETDFAMKQGAYEKGYLFDVLLLKLMLKV